MEPSPFDARPLIRLLVLDIDGVLTDGRVYFATDGVQSKSFSFLDIMGISLAQRSGLKIALISGEANPIVDALAAKLGIEEVFQGCKDKAGALRAVCERYGLEPGAACYVGDDVNDLPAMEVAGVAVAVPSAHVSVLQRAAYVTRASAGAGAVREITDLILARALGAEEGTS